MGEENIDAAAQGVHDAEVFLNCRVSAIKGVGNGGHKIRADPN